MKRDLDDWYKRCEALIKLCSEMAYHLPQSFKDEAASLIKAVREASVARTEPEAEEQAPKASKKSAANG